MHPDDDAATAAEPTPTAEPTPPSQAGPGADLIRELEAQLELRVVVYFAERGPMGRWDARPLHNLLEELGHQNEAAIVIQSTGGSADAAHLLLNLLREYVIHLHVYVPTYAASAATLFALGADTLWMGPSSELSPIDPQVPVDPKLLIPAMDPSQLPFGPEQPVMIPAHVIKDFLELTGVIESPIKRPKIDTERLETLLKPLNPWILGWYERADKTSRLYARAGLVDHLLRDTVDVEEREQLANEIIEALLDGYASHEAGILRTEARTIGIPVRDVPDEVWKHLNQISEFYENVLRTQSVGRVLETTDGFHVTAAEATIQCRNCGEVVRQEPSFRFCPQCGRAYFRTCSCGQRLDEDWKHCPACGVSVNSVSG